MNAHIDLSTLTRQAIEAGQKEAQRRKLSQAEEDAQKQTADRTKADEIVVQIPDRVHDAAAAEQTYAVVMGLREGADFVRPQDDQTWSFCDERWLVGAAKLVWQDCLDARLNPKLQYWGDEKNGRGFNIVIHWQQRAEDSGPMDVAEWRQLTDRAIEEGRREAARLEAEQARAAEQQRQIERAKALEIISQIPNRARTAALAKQSYAIVMGLREGSDIKRPPGNYQYSTCSVDWLAGTAKLVWDACVQNKLKPELQYWYDGGGMDSGFNLVIHW